MVTLIQVASDWQMTSLFRKVVGAEGFELSTYGTQNRRATRLRYAPTDAPLAGGAANEKPYSSQGQAALS